MTERLDLAISRLQGLPETEQARVAETILEMIGNIDGSPALSADQAAEVRSRRQGLREGSETLALAAEMNELWAHCRLRS